MFKRDREIVEEEGNSSKGKRSSNAKKKRRNPQETYSGDKGEKACWKGRFLIRKERAVARHETTTRFNFAKR